MWATAHLSSSVARCLVNTDAIVIGSAGVLPQGVDGLLGIKYLQARVYPCDGSASFDLLL